MYYIFIEKNFVQYKKEMVREADKLYEREQMRKGAEDAGRMRKEK